MVPSPLGHGRGRGASARLRHPRGEFLGLGRGGLDGCPGNQRKRFPDNVSTVGAHVGEVLRHRFGLPVRVHRAALSGQRRSRRGRAESVRQGRRRAGGRTSHLRAARLGPAVPAGHRTDREPGLPRVAAQSQSVAGRSVRGCAERITGEHVDSVLVAPERPQPPPGPGGARACAFSTATGTIDPGAGAGRGPGLGRLGAALARHLDPPGLGQEGPPQPDVADGAVAGRRASRHSGAKPVDPRAVRCLGRYRRPAAHRRLHAK